MEDINLLLDEVFPPDYSVIFLHAHPDDESFLTAGLINELTLRGRECFVVYGAAGRIPNEDKTVLRQRESVKALKTLGAKHKPLYLKTCDSKFLKRESLSLSSQKVKDISEQFLELLSKNKLSKPFILVSYDENGGYGNSDHIFMNKLGRVFKSIHKDLVIFLYEATLNRSLILGWFEDAKKRLSKEFLPELSYWSEKFGLPEEEITYKYKLSSKQLKVKREALAKHKSQIKVEEFPLVLSGIDFKSVFGNEYLKLVE